MFKNNKIKLKLLVPLSILSIIFLLLTSSIIFHHYNKTKSLESLNMEIILTTKLSEVLHEIQRERGISIVYIRNNGEVFKMQYELQIEVTNNSINELQIFLKKTYNQGSYKNILNNLDDLQRKIAELNTMRQSILLDKKYNINTIANYTEINTKILNTIIEISKISQLPKITQNIIAYSNFLYFKEYAGIERAIGASIIKDKTYNNDKIMKFHTNFERQKHSKEFFEKYISKEMLPIYNKILKHKSFQIVQENRKILLNLKETGTVNISTFAWFEYTTNRIDQLHIIDEYLYNEIITNIQYELDNSYLYFIVFGFLNLLIIVLFLLLVIIIYRMIKNEQKLKIMMDKYIISSTTDLKGKITSASEAFCNISGYSEMELIGKSQNISRHPDMPNKVFHQMWTTIKNGNTWIGKVKNIKKNGDYYWVHANIEPIFNDKGKIESYAAIRLDITEAEDLQTKINFGIEKSKQQDQAMQQQSRLAQMGEMISMIAHQWRQPLSAISSTSGAINLKAKLNKLDKDTAIELSSKISQYSQHLSNTIDDFREFFKSNKEKRDTNYCNLIKSVLGIVEISIENQNIEIIKDLNCNEKFSTYPNELKQVILNIIKNAEDVLLENEIVKPYIKISTFKENNNHILTISDNGGGIPTDIIDKIFDPYFSTKTKKDGTGLGLYMSKTIIEEHCGGKLSVSNDIDGAIFKIKLKNKEEKL